MKYSKISQIILLCFGKSWYLEQHTEI